MGRVTLAFLWHMHQPFYVDLAEGRATLPWVRLHALKDYYDLPAIARRFPSVHQTFNLVPCLLDQLEAYAEGRLTDPFLEVASRGAHELTREDRLFLLREFFSYHPPTMGARLPRLEQLRRKRGARPPHPGDDAAFAAWREADYRDLQVLFHLAWCGPELSSRPPVARLIAKGAAFTQEELDGLLEIQRGFLREVEEQYRLGAGEGILELSVSPYYHPILPLLCDTASARESGPHLALPSVPFHHPDDAAVAGPRGAPLVREALRRGPRGDVALRRSALQRRARHPRARGDPLGGDRRGHPVRLARDLAAGFRRALVAPAPPLCRPGGHGPVLPRPSPLRPHRVRLLGLGRRGGGGRLRAAPATPSATPRGARTAWSR